jgi:glycerophosphoryl diester phosphodiesterase
MPALIRVGHRGAAAIAPANTFASFDAAIAVGVEMIEFDVLPSREGRELYVAHDYGALDRHSSPTLEAALAHMSTPAYDGIRLQLDIKRPGLEPRVLAALDQVGARSRALISTGIWRTLVRFRELAPELKLGWTVPEMPGALLHPPIAGLYRRRLPARAARRIRAGAIDALVPHWGVVTPALVEAVRAAGGELYTWTVDDAAQIERLRGLGVTGVITNDPRLFAGPPLQL